MAMMLRMIHAKDLNETQLQELCIRASAEDKSATEVVEKIIEEVIAGGEDAVRNFVKKFDHANLTSLTVSEDEFEKAEIALSQAKDGEKLKDAFRTVARNIEEFHLLQQESLQSAERTVAGTLLGYRYKPVHSAGIYVPGGKATYPSSVLMGLIPAKIANVSYPFLITPCRPDGQVSPIVLFCAGLAGAKAVLKVGGAHGIAAAAYGVATERAEVIVGPGNRYVTTAKMILTAKGVIRMDLPAGPSEVIIIADQSAHPLYVASDLLSQAEHGSDSPALLCTNSLEFAVKVNEEIENALQERRSRIEMKRESLEKHSFILIVEDIKDAFEFSNRYAPEHLEICTENPLKDFDLVTSAGSVFIGSYAPVAVGDYFSGSNHILPTGGAAKFYSGLGVDTFLKRITYQHPTKESLRMALEPIMLMSKAEGFDEEHGHSVAVRFQQHKR